MLEKKPSIRKLRKGHVFLSVMKQIKEDSEKLWKSARSLTGTDDDHDHDHDLFDENPVSQVPHPGEASPESTPTRTLEPQLHGHRAS